MNLSLKTHSSALATVVCLSLSLSAAAQTAASSGTRAALAPRITSPIVNSARATLTGSRPPLASSALDAGAVSSDMKLSGIALVFSRTPAQQAELDTLVAAQQNPASPLYHQWLTPDQFAARFGVAEADIAAAESWLQLQGFSVDSVSRSRDRIFFSGTAALVGTAFGAPLHYFNLPATATRPAARHFAPSADLTIPAALASTVLTVTNLSDFRPHSHLIHTTKDAGLASAIKPAFTSSSSGNHFITPGDINIIYDVNPAYSAGYTGANQSIVVVGQSAVDVADVSAFQSAAGVNAKTPQVVLVPLSGTSTIYQGDESESDLDLEYTSTIGKNAQVYFVYTGNNPNYGVFNSLQYAIDQKISPIISVSYGACETELGATNYTQLNAILQQGAAQGQTVVVAAGDAGSTDCDGFTDLTDAQQAALAVDFPASSQYVTAMGGTEFTDAAVANGNNTYFAAQSTTDIVASALSYIPEQVWNDDAPAAANGATDPFASGGGGVSIYTPRPTWQSGTIGGVAFPAGTFRLVPDISLDASPYNAPMVYCTSDTSSWSTGQTASCNSGFRDSSTGALTIAGGTSFDAPIFAGMLSLINESLGSTGQGVINPTLYTLAATPATYTSAFHDTTAGNNACGGGPTYCITSNETSYAATTGYDEASGLGSIDLYNLLTAWPQLTGVNLASTTTTLVAAVASPAPGASDVITISVAPIVSTTVVPTGTVALTVDGVAPTSATTFTLVNGIATYTFSSATTGTHSIVAAYSGDTTFAASTGTLVINVPVQTVGAFTLSATNITVTSGNSGTSTITITPSGGYTGTVDLTLTTTANLPDSCYAFANPEISVTGTAAVPTTVTLYTNISDCVASGANSTVKGLRHRFTTIRRADNTPPHSNPSNRAPFAAAAAGLLALALLRKRPRGLPALLVIFLLGVAALGVSGCSNNATSPYVDSGNETKGTYALTLTGTDPSTGQTSATNFNLIVQ